MIKCYRLRPDQKRDPSNCEVNFKLCGSNTCVKEDLPCPITKIHIDSSEKLKVNRDGLFSIVDVKVS